MIENKIKYIYWFAYYNLDSPSVRYRAKYPLEYFKKKYDITSTLIIPGYSLKNILTFFKTYLSLLFYVNNNSLIVVQRVQSNFIYANLLKVLILIRKNISVYDIDDADYLEFKPNTIYWFAKRCKTISAGSNKIKEHLSKFNDNIVHTTSPIVDLHIKKERKNKTLTIGWIGGFGGAHKEELINLVFPAIYDLSFQLNFILIGVTQINDIEYIQDFFKNKKNINIQIPLNVDWNNEYYIQQEIVKFDIGIATLQNTEIQLAKSGIKVKQYMNNGVPVLSSKLPENWPLVINGQNGYYCSTINEFKERMIEFNNMTNKEFMYFSKNARKTIRKFDLDKYYNDFLIIKTTTQQKI